MSTLLHARHALAAFTLTTTLGASGHAHAQSMVDPTRPPIGGAPAASRADAPARSAPAAPPSLPQLQALQVPRDGAPSALVDGKLVHTGERIGEHTVVAIAADGVTLRSARGTTRVLTMFAGITKTPSVARATPPASAATSVATRSRQETP